MEPDIDLERPSEARARRNLKFDGDLANGEAMETPALVEREEEEEDGTSMGFKEPTLRLANIGLEFVLSGLACVVESCVESAEGSTNVTSACFLTALIRSPFSSKIGTDGSADI